MMYTIRRGPSRLVTPRRTGPTQQIEPKVNDLKSKASCPLPHDPHPKIVFIRPNRKWHRSAAAQSSGSPAGGFSPAHEENVKFVYEAWQEVEQKLGDGEEEESRNSRGPVQYAEKTPSAAAKGFVPMDLEEWWAQRFLANISNLS
ncbi:MAPK regulated corepressor interacting protein 2 [Brachionichthys hirsutus]|uniref:MAPK regulated corepressor interacting protein 2 n=1 Tax=Brachionichthys hirsutus TaxID=412623 RepID=UPI00360494A3